MRANAADTRRGGIALGLVIGIRPARFAVGGSGSSAGTSIWRDALKAEFGAVAGARSCFISCSSGADAEEEKEGREAAPAAGAAAWA
jgi:hypothetical protein